MEENTSKVYIGSAPVATPAAGGGSPLFVINLCASIAPVPTTGKNLPGLDNYRLYQVARVEDGRTRHRLRLGFFTSESHAESVLTVVRQQYPTAFTACLCDEDRKFTRGFLPDSALAASAPAPAPVKRPMAVVPPPASNPAPIPSPVSVAPVAAAAPPAPAAKPVAPAMASVSKAPAPAASKTLTPAEPEVIELNWEPDAEKARAAAATAARAPAPAATSPAVNQDAGLDEFTWEPPALQAPAPSSSDTARHPVVSPGYKTQPVVKAAPPAKPAAAKTTAPVAKVEPAAKPAESKPVAKTDAATSTRLPALELSFTEPPPPAAQESKAATTPFHVGKGVEIADLSISLQAEAPPVPAAAAKSVAAPAPAPAKVAPVKQAAPVDKPAKPAVPAAKAPAPTKAAPAPTKPAAPTPVAASKPMPVAIVRNPMANLPDLDSTQTIRALTSAELNDDAQDKWFAIQLAASEQPVNLDAMPHLDIFEAYRLYSVATAGSGKIVHSLRLGFFKEAVSAEAVGGYLKTFFGSPTVLRVSVAEQARFKDAPAPKKAEPAKAEAKVVELSNARAVRPIVPTVTVEVEPPSRLDTSATGSFNPNATGAFNANATGSFRAGATGTHKALKPAAKSAGATKRQKVSTSSSGRHKALVKKSLSEQLMEEAREVQLSESGIRRLPKNDSLLSRLVGKLTK